MLNKLMLLLMVSALLFGCQTQSEQQNAEQKGNDEKVMAEEVTSVENFTLEDYTGQEHSLSDYKDSNAIVLMFIATRCPISNDYNERMAQLYADYREKDVAFIGINSNKQEDVEEIKNHAQENDLQFPILKDHNNIIADKLEASVTPEVYVLDSEFNVLYQGRIDDSRRPDEVTTKDLRKTLDEILASEEVTVTRTKAFGCTIKRVET